MAALKQMGDRDLKELGIPMVRVVSVTLFGKSRFANSTASSYMLILLCMVTPIHFPENKGILSRWGGKKAKLLDYTELLDSCYTFPILASNCCCILGICRDPGRRFYWLCFPKLEGLCNMVVLCVQCNAPLLFLS